MTSTFPSTPCKRRCTAIASSCASSAIARTAAPKAASSRCSSAPRSTVVGRYEVDRSGLGFVAPFDKRLTTDIQIPRTETKDAEPGQMVTVEVTRWPTPTRGPAGRIVEVLGDINDPGVDTEIILRKHGIPDEHGADAIAEAKRIGTRGPREGHRRPHRFSRPQGRHHRRRARARFRRCDLDRETQERQLLARRAYRRRRALRARRRRRSTRRPTSAAPRCISPSAPCTCSRAISPPGCAV